MNEIYLDLMETRNIITGKGFVEYRLWNDFHEFSGEITRPEDFYADSWAEVENLSLFRGIIGESAEFFNEQLYDFLSDMKDEKTGIIINDTFYDYDRIKEFLDLLVISDLED
jgi:hypothetical protein